MSVRVSFVGFIALLSVVAGQSPDFKQCETDVEFPWSGLSVAHKGLTIDDTTMQYCSSEIPAIWPNTQLPLRSMRLFEAWREDWAATYSQLEVWAMIAEYASTYGVKILIGTPVTCDAHADDRSWEWTKSLLKMLDSSNVMGLAVGNELDILKFHGSKACVEDLWDGGRFWEIFQSRVAEFDQMGFGQIPVTSAFTATVLFDRKGLTPFENEPGVAMANDFFMNGTQKYGKRFVFTFNFYPYFDPNFKMDPGGDNCSIALAAATCWQSGCSAPKMMVDARQKMQQLTNRPDFLFWVGEIGWATPRSDSLVQSGSIMASCDAWSSPEAFHAVYDGFLKWDMSLAGVMPVNHAFYFTLRDALNFGTQEHFGLMTTCQSMGCKIARKGFKASHTEFHGGHVPWKPMLFGGIACTFAFVLVCTCLYVSSSGFQKMVNAFDRESDASGPESVIDSADESS